MTALKTAKKRFGIACILVFCVLALLLPAGALAEKQFSIDLKGLLAGENGKWSAVPLNYDFEVYGESGAKLDTLTSYATQEQVKAGKKAVLSLPDSTMKLTVRPVLNGGASDYAFEASYEIDFSAYNPVNYPLLVYANKGFFSLESVFEDGQPAPQAEFELKRISDSAVWTIRTDESGRYSAQAAIPAGEYELTVKTPPKGGLQNSQAAVFVIPVYRAETDRAQVKMVSARISEENLSLAQPNIVVASPAPSLLGGNQTLLAAVQGFGLAKNSMALSSYTAKVNHIALTDADGVPLPQGGAALQKIAYQNEQDAYKAVITLLNADGQPVGETINLLAGETAVIASAQAVGFTVSYADKAGRPVLPAGFDGGSILLTLGLSGRVADAAQREARGIGMDVSAAWTLDGTDTVLGGESFALLKSDAIMDGTAALIASVAADESHAAVITLSNGGGVALPAGTYDIALPQGWRAGSADDNVAIVRMKDADLVSIRIDKPLAPNETLSAKVKLIKAEAKGNATVYVKSAGVLPATLDNPSGNLIKADYFDINPLTGIAQGALYAAVDAAASAPAAFDNMVHGGEKSGVIFEDKNGSATLDNGEAGIEGLSVLLTGEGSAVRWHALTDAQGRFTFYETDEMIEARLLFTLPENMMAVGLEKDERGYVPPEGDMVLGIAVTCSITGTVTADGAGVRDVRVIIRDAGGRGIADVHATTDASGAYRAGGLAAGAYTVSFEMPDTLKERYALENDGQHISVELTDERKEAVVSQKAVALGALLIRAEGLSAPGMMTAQLFSGGVLSQTAQSDENGRIRFSGLMPGEYTVAASFSDGWLIQKGQSSTQAVNISGGAETQAAFEAVRAAQITGEITSVKAGVGVSVSIMGEGIAQTLQDAAQFAFTGLYEGSYTLSVHLPDGVIAAPGGEWEKSASAMQYQIHLAPGETAALEPLTLQMEGSVMGYIWKDKNGDGAFTADEPGIAGVPITLEAKTEKGYEAVLETVTDGYGAYTFQKLMPGTYRVHADIGKANAFVADGNQSRFLLSGYTEPFEVFDGADIAGISGGVVTPAPLKAVVFLDANQNGERGIYERPLPGALIEVLTKDGLGVLAQGTTDAEGTVLFPEMMQGEVRVRVTLPDGYGFTKKGKGTSVSQSAIDRTEEKTALTDVISLVEGKENGVAAGAAPLGQVSGFVWHDSDGDGVMQSSESGQAGVTLSLVPKKESGVTYTLVTDETGYYLFDRVREGTYDLVVTAPEGMMFTRYSATGREKRSIMTGEGKRTGAKLIEVSGGKTVTDQNLGFIKEAAISGLVFIDENYNGLYDEGEKGLAGVKITVEKAATNDEMGKVVTDESGSFEIGALRGNTYRVKATLPDDGVIYTKVVALDTAGNHIAQRSDRRDGAEENVLVGDGETAQILIGAVYPGKITGTVYYDDDYSGDRQPGEKGAAGLEIRLKNAESAEVGKTQTDKEGHYAFAGLTPGEYTVWMSTAKGSVYVIKGDDSLMASTDASVGVTKPVSVLMGQETAHIDGGLILPATVSGTVYADVNDNGQRDADEPGYENVKIMLYNESGEPAADALATGTDGTYLFKNLMPGRYYIRCEVGENERITAGFSTSVQTGVFEIKSGQNLNVPELGALKLGAVKGMAFEDSNGSGTWDSGEAALAGVTVTLIPARADLAPVTAVTDAAGAFALTALRPGDYTMQIQAPDGMVFSKDAQGAYSARTGKAADETVLSLLMGEEKTDGLISVTAPAAIQGVIFLDKNNNGLIDENEGGVSGLTVTLYDQNAQSAVMETMVSGDGSFVFEGVIPSRYTVYAPIPPNHIAVSDDTMNMTDLGDGTIGMRDIDLFADEWRGDLIGGLLRLTEWGGQVFMDQGGTYIPLSGAQVELISQSGRQSQTAMTGEDGQYLFASLLPDDYMVSVKLPSGYLLVSPHDNSAQRPQTLIKADNSGMGTSDVMGLVMGQDVYDLNIAAVRPGSIGDKVWLDENGNGLQETGERPIEGVTVEIIRDGRTIAQAVSNAAGFYFIKDIYPSVYDVRITFPSGLAPTVRRTDIPLLASVMDGAEGTIAWVKNVEIQSGVINRDFDLGFVLTDKKHVPDAVKEIQKQTWR